MDTLIGEYVMKKLKKGLIAHLRCNKAFLIDDVCQNPDGSVTIVTQVDKVIMTYRHHYEGVYFIEPEGYGSHPLDIISLEEIRLEPDFSTMKVGTKLEWNSQPCFFMMEDPSNKQFIICSDTDPKLRELATGNISFLHKSTVLLWEEE